MTQQPEPATESQKSYLETLEQQTGEHVDDLDHLSKTEASEIIEELQHKRTEVDPQQHDPQDIAADTDPDLSDEETA